MDFDDCIHQWYAADIVYALRDLFDDKLDKINIQHQWYAADIVYALRDLFDDKLDKINIQDERFQSFIMGYKSIRPIPDEGLKNILLQFRLHNLHSYARIHWSISDGPIDGEPKWVTNLRDKLAQSNEEYKEELIPRFL